MACSRAAAIASVAGSSMASYSPVEAPLGAAARPKPPDSVRTSASTVGFPRESRTRRRETDVMSVMSLPLPLDGEGEDARVVLLRCDQYRFGLLGLHEDRCAVRDLQ